MRSDDEVKFRQFNTLLDALNKEHLDLSLNSVGRGNSMALKTLTYRMVVLMKKIKKIEQKYQGKAIHSVVLRRELVKRERAYNVSAERVKDLTARAMQMATSLCSFDEIAFVNSQLGIEKKRESAYFRSWQGYKNRHYAQKHDASLTEEFEIDVTQTEKIELLPEAYTIKEKIINAVDNNFLNSIPKEVPIEYTPEELAMWGTSDFSLTPATITKEEKK